MHNVSIKFSNYCYNGDTINIHKLIETIIVHRIDKLNFVLLLPNIEHTVCKRLRILCNQCGYLVIQPFVNGFVSNVFRRAM